MKIPYSEHKALHMHTLALCMALICPFSWASDKTVESNATVTLPPKSATHFPSSSEIIINRPASESEAPSSAPAPRIPGAITTVSIQNTVRNEQLNIPVTFGQAFAQGDVFRTDTLAAKLPDGSMTPVQIDIKALYRDGSVKHAVISLILPKLDAGQTQYIGIVKSERATAKNITTGKS